MLNVQIQGSPTTATPVLIVHGLFGSARNWGVIAKRLSDRGQVVTVDMRNHGASPWYDSHTYDDMAEDLAQVIRPFGQMDVVGHSMGGKAAMMLALRAPALIRRLLVADIAPVSYGHSQRHLINAMRQVDLTQVTRRSEANAQLIKAVPDDGTRAFLLQSLDVAARGWRLNLDVLDRDMDLITGWPDPTGTIDVPTLFLAGAQSDYITTEGRSAAKSLFKNARFAKIPNAGHWLHADNPRAFEATIRAFLDV